MKVLIVGDSHAKRMPKDYIKSHLKLHVISISGLQWMCNGNNNLSLFHLLFTSEFQSFLSRVDKVLFLIGTNSVRCFSANTIISQVEETVFLLRQIFPQFSRPNSISLSLTFPCFKINRRFSTTKSLVYNIQLYNDHLYQLSLRDHFEIIDCRVKRHHVANDNIHLHPHVYHRLFLFILRYLNHFNA